LLAIAAGALAATAQQGDDVEIKTTKLTATVSMLEGRGGNIGVSAGPDGILIVDDQFENLAPKIRAALEKLGQGPPKFILNTHWHGDHTGGNKVFGKDGVIVAHENVRARLAAGGGNREPAPKEALPVLTFKDGLSIHFNGEEIRVIHFPRGHTDGDSIIFFTKSNVVHMGDYFFAGRFPFVDLRSGGDVEGYLKNIDGVLGLLDAEVKIIPGHGPLSTLNDLKAFQSMLRETIEAVRERAKAGKSLDEAQKEGLGEKWKDWGGGFISTERWIETIYADLKAKAGK
jgi:glyoxylase-like metal-dependent hydrolase (beta-lactamase superfamily II)